MSKNVFKIGILGPSRIGKTSLITAILGDSQKLLAGTSLKMQFEENSPTGIRIKKYQKDLRGDIHAGEFEPGKLGGSQEPFIFELEVDAGLQNSKLNLSIQDYPGGWLDPLYRPPGREADWISCQNWIKDSTVLIIPVDATVVMEAREPKHKRVVPSVLGIDDIRDVVRFWAKEQREKPIMLMLCPVKCEAYFDDNIVKRDKSEKLYEEIARQYDDVFDAARQESQNVTINYFPIDTIGCVDIKSAEWRPDERAVGQFDFSATYMVLEPKKQKILGADSVLISICEHIMELFRYEMVKQKETNESKIHDIKRVLDPIENPNTIGEWFNSIFSGLIGDTSNLKKDLALANQKSEEIGVDITTIKNIVDEIRDKKLSHQRAKVVR